MAVERGVATRGENRRLWLGDDEGCYVAFSFLHLICAFSFVKICERWD